MKNKSFPDWTTEEIELLKSNVKTKTLALHPLLVARGRTYGAISNRRTKMKSNGFTGPTGRALVLGECSRICNNEGVCDMSCEPQKKAA